MLDLKCDILEQLKVSISQEAIHKKFTPQAVLFLQELLSEIISSQLKNISHVPSSAFTAVNIKDSSKIKLPKEFAKTFPGYGGYNIPTALMNIQFEYDLLTQNWKSFDITSALRNDQQDSRETADEIQQGSLNIRDLGYITSTYLNEVINRDAYFLNRLPKMSVYIKKHDDYVLLDWKQLNKQIGKSNLESLDLEVYIGKKEKIKCRLIISAVPDDIKAERIRKAKQGGKRKKGYEISDEHKIKLGFNIYITNVMKEDLSNEEVKQTYRLRWQIELMFKSWKTNLKINKIKAIKLERMLCQVYAKMIWIILNSSILGIINRYISKQTPDKCSSLAKFFKLAKKYTKELRVIVENLEYLHSWFESRIIPQIPNIILEQRQKKPTHYQILYNLILL